MSSYSDKTKEASFLTFEGAIEVGVVDKWGNIKNGVWVKPGQKLALFLGQAPGNPVEVPNNELKKEKQSSSADEGGTGDQGSTTDGQNGGKKKKGEKKKTKTASTDGEGGEKSDGGSKQQKTTGGDDGGGEKKGGSLIGDLIEEEGGGLPEGSQDVGTWEQQSLGELPPPQVTPLVKIECQSCEDVTKTGTTNLLIDVNLSDSN